MNGRCGTDKGIGNFTFMGPMGNSVIDYFICCKAISNFLLNFKVSEMSESLHFPIEVKLETKMIGSKNVQVNEKDKIQSKKYDFNVNNIGNFIHNIEENFMSRDIFNESVNDIDNYNVDINNIIDKMIFLI